MTILPLVWILAGVQHNTSATRLRLSGENFVISRAGHDSERIPVEGKKPEAPKKMEYRSDETFVLWDERGLTIRVGGNTISTRLKAIPTSPRLRAHEAIVETLHGVRNDGLSLEANALSGSCRFGKTVYLVARWQTEEGRVWLEALVSVDLGAKEPAAKALAVLPGLSFSSGAIAENLVGGPDSASILVHSGSKWGVWTFNPGSSQSAFHQMGDGIKYAAPVSPELAAFVEKTETGSYTAGTVDLLTGKRTDAVEATNLWKMVDSKRPPVAQATKDNGDNELAELVTGAVLDLPPDATVRRSDAGILVWVGGKHPSRAWLYNPSNWKPLAWWKPTATRRDQG